MPEIAAWVLIIWLSGSGKAITVLPGQWKTQQECNAVAEQYVPKNIDRFCMPAPAR